MHLLVDAQTLQTAAAHRGMGRYAKNLLGALARARPAWRIEAVVNTSLPAPVGDGRTVPFRPFTPPLPAETDAREANERYLGDWLSATGADAVLELSFFDEEALVPQFTPPRPPLAGIAYDLIPLLFHEQYLRERASHAIYRRRFRQCLQADLLLAISDTTRHDVMRLMRLPSDRVVTIGGAAEPLPPPAGTDADAGPLHRLDIEREFLLYVGGTDPRKNLGGALAAYAALPPAVRNRHQLVIACALTPLQRESLHRDAEALGIAPRLRLTGYIDDGTLRTLYEACRLSVFPTFYEGLGLPVLEALGCGAPVVASNRSAVPEFASEDVAVLVDPGSTAGLAAAIQQALAEPRTVKEGARRDFAASFTWDTVAHRAAEALDHLPERVAMRRGPPTERRPAERLRIAWVAPVPPDESAGSRGAAQVLPGIAAQFEVELVLKGCATLARGVGRGLPVLRPHEVWDRHRTHPYDLFVYHLDAEVPHEHVLDLIRVHSGLVVLHDTDRTAAGPDAWSGLLGSNEAAVVQRPALWQGIRQRHPALPLFFVPAGHVAAAAAYAAAIRVTVARRAWRDGEWIDAVSGALAETRQPAGSLSALLAEWANLRAASHELRRPGG